MTVKCNEFRDNQYVNYTNRDNVHSKVLEQNFLSVRLLFLGVQLSSFEPVFHNMSLHVTLVTITVEKWSKLFSMCFITLVVCFYYLKRAYIITLHPEKKYVNVINAAGGFEIVRS